MADKNVLRHDVVEIGFEVDSSGLAKLEQRFNSSRTGVEKASNAMQKSTDACAKAISAADKASSSFNDTVGKGLKAKQEEDRAIESAAKAYAQLSEKVSSSASVYDSLSERVTAASEEMQKYAKNGDMSAESLSKLEEYSSAAEQSLKELEAAQTAADKAIEDFNQSTNKTGLTLQEVRATEEKMTKALNELAKAEDNAKKATGDYEDALGRFKTQNEDSTKSVTGLEAALASVGITAALAKIEQKLLECSDAAAQFESALAKVSTIADTSQTSMGAISDQLMRLSRNTGKSVSELSEATYQAISASVDTADAVSFVEKASRLATAGFTEQATAADVLTTAINAYKLSIEDTEKISDMLITTQNLGKTSVDELASSMGKVIPLAAAYNVEMDNLSAAYAEMTKGGIATAEATTYIKSMMNELGDSSKTVAKVLQEQTGQTFAELMSSGKSLADVLQIVGDSVNGDTTAFNNLWGSQEAGIGALALYNSGAAAFNQTLQKMQSSAGATSAAYQKLANTTEFSKNKMQNAFENLEISIGKGLNPVMSSLYNSVADVTNGFSEFVEEHPSVATALAGVTTALTVATGAVTAYTVATKAADIMSKTFNKTLSAGKLGLIVTGIAAAGAAIGWLAGAFSDAEEQVEDYNGTLEQCRNELDETQEKYNAVVSAYGEQSEAAKQLRTSLDTLNAQYQKGGGFAAEYAQRVKESSDAAQDFKRSYQEQLNALSNTQISGQIALAQLQSLSEKTMKTSTDLEYMRSVAESLNTQYHMSIEVDYDTGELKNFDFKSFNQVLVDSYNKAKADAAYASLYSQETVDNYTKAWKNYQQFQEKYNNALKAKNANARAANALDLNQNSGSGLSSLFGTSQTTSQSQKAIIENTKEYLDAFSDFEKAKSDLESYSTDFIQRFQDMGYSLEDATKAARIYEQQMLENYSLVADSSEKSSDSVIRSQEAIGRSLITVNDNLSDLTQKYQETYEACKESFDGQFGIFDIAQSDAEATVSKAQEALQSQIEYWKSYADNMSYLSSYSAEQLGVTQEEFHKLSEYLNSGTPEMVGLANNIVSTLKSDTAEGKQQIAQLTQSIAEADTQRSRAADEAADWYSEFSKKSGEYIKDIGIKIDRLKALGQPAQSATENIAEGMRKGLENGYRPVISAAQAIVDGVNKTFANLKTDYTVNVGQSGSVSGIAGANASGTLSAPRGINLVGEEGPELVWMNGGERVFNNSETGRILEGLANNKRDVNVYIPRSVDEAVNYTPEKDAARMVVNNDNSSNNVNNHSYNITLNMEFNGVSGNDQRKIAKLVEQGLEQALEKAKFSNYSVIEI